VEPLLLVVDHLYRDASLPETSRAYARDTVTLGWEERVRAHGRRQSDGGLEFAVALPRGSVVRAGDCFVLDEARAIVTVVERQEPVFVIEPRSASDWALYAYQIGNRHQPIMITGGFIACPDVPGMEQLLHQHHIPFRRATQPFTPVSGSGGGHQH
jgi:urease accessory protein